MTLTQADRVLRRLHYGPISPYDFLQPVVDGGKPILRVAARVQDLRDRGYHISTTTAANGTAVYELTQVDVERSIVPAPEDYSSAAGSHRAIDASLGSALAQGSDGVVPPPPSEPPLFAVDDHNYRDEAS
jgi:hypothetical protein